MRWDGARSVNFMSETCGDNVLEIINLWGNNPVSDPIYLMGKNVFHSFSYSASKQGILSPFEACKMDISSYKVEMLYTKVFES